MATQSVPAKLDRASARVGDGSITSVLSHVLTALASLKLTVALFALGIVLVLIGTLAQAQMDMWDVLNDYFQAWIAYVNIQVLFPQSFFPEFSRVVPEAYFPFPGGATIGLLMVINLLTAHLVRFKVQAKGSRLLIGLFIIALGILTTWAVIDAGHNEEGLQAQPFFEWSQLWQSIRIGTVIVWLLLLFPLVRLVTQGRWESRYLEVGLLALLQFTGLGVLIWMFAYGGQMPPSVSSLRILWQLIQAQAAALVMIAGCVTVFGKRGGIVLLHGGIGLMMFGEFFVGMNNVEQRMTIVEGQTTQFADDIRTTELAIVDTSPKDHDDVVVIPREMLLESDRENTVIEDERLPFAVKVLEYHRNTDVRAPKEGEKSPATAGRGTELIIEPLRPASGADASGEVDLASAYVQFLDKKSGKPLDTHLVSLLLSLRDLPEKVQLGDKTYDVYLRFKRSYKPYSMQLIDVVREDYMGTVTPRDYASLVRIKDPTLNVDREVKIWMNNPLRYAGETYYQSHYDRRPDGTELTVFQVVRNTGWMIPYVACVLVWTGLLYHFGGTLLRFLRRREREIASADELQEMIASQPQPGRGRNDKKLSPSAAAATAVNEPQQPWGHFWFPVIMGLLTVMWLGYKWVPRSTPDAQVDLRAFGRLPVHSEGRLKPLDTLARNTLRVISNRETFKDNNDEKQPAIRWLLDVIADVPEAMDYRVVRIDSPEVLQTLGLQPRKGFRYAISEFRDKFDEFEEQARLAAELREKSPEQLSYYQKKILQLDGHLKTYLKVSAAFRTLPLPVEIPTEQQLRENPEKYGPTLMMMKRLVDTADDTARQLAAIQPPLAVPPFQDKEDAQAAANKWQPYASAWMADYRTRIRNTFADADDQAEVNPATMAYHRMFEAYRGTLTGSKLERLQAVKQFNAQVAEYQALLDESLPGAYLPGKVRFEEFYNYLAPFFHSQVVYLVAFVLAIISWLGWSRPLNRASFWMIFMALWVHTFALIARMYISGRPPVTTLYSSAIFIGWAAVIAGLVLEILFGMGIGNIVGGVLGFATLIIAGFLALDGDTMPVLQAVLDTQFWLATHVVCVTLGYGATFVAGLLGVLYIVQGVLTPRLDKTRARFLNRMTYGTLCFALLFSLIGTVLGGLWADDSWGRFWGWDPKENGALIIVMWNALVLHARWDGMVRERGLAVLAIGGNIATSWSWFGVNELGVGLHAYGFTEGVLRALALFVLSQFIIIAMGLLPRQWWRSSDLQMTG